MAKSPAHISLLALLLNSEPHREALMRVLTAAQVPIGTPPDRIEETINSIFSSTISFSDDELPPEGCAHFRRGAPFLSVSTSSRRPLLPGATSHRHHLPRTGHADSRSPVRLADAFLPRG
ncbi:hypothetical protein CRG98_006816 [Punica granatum]|uniref:Uncharacterized protein n=1 Tax=Punica granatum TaxID=22663 RepID=A0A2I0KWE3_PUNGR|nr:hypothetical protein CRG98_006816 [Punica granatum]